MILTPIKAYSSQNSSTEEHSRDTDSHHPSSLIGSDSQGSDCKDSAAGGMQQHHLPGCEGESGGAPLPEGDLPGQFTRVMGKGECLSLVSLLSSLLSSLLVSLLRRAASGQGVCSGGAGSSLSPSSCELRS